VGQLWPGKRPFEFEKPYVDQYGLGRYAPGDPYCDADHTGRYEAPYIAGGSGQNHWPTAIDPGNGLQAEAVVMALGSRKVAIVSVDSIGMFNVTMDRIRSAVTAADPSVSDVFISSTHDESAPDPIGLWGPDPSDLPTNPSPPAATSSGVDEYYMTYLVNHVAGAVVNADHGTKPAQLRAAVGQMPSNTQSCWSSYPYIDNQDLPVLQAVDPSSGNVIATLVDVSTHAETYAFSGIPSYISTFSADWPGQMRQALEQRWPGSVGVELAGMVGSVETPTVYEPESTQVVKVPGALHDVSGNPDGCASVYPNPSSGTPVSDPRQFLSAYGQSVADAATGTLASGTQSTPASLSTQHQSLCVQLENNFFVGAGAADLFPDRPLYADPTCSVGVQTGSGPAPPGQTGSGQPQPGNATWLKTDVGLVTVGDVQLAYSPGEVFPFTEVRGPIDQNHMPFPTDCFNPATNDYYCGNPLPMTPWISAKMTRPYRFLVGLGEDMIGYLFPPGNFVGAQGETNEQPWATYEDTAQNGGRDRFGQGHADDAESAGPHAGLSVVNALSGLIGQQGAGSTVLPGLYVDAGGHLSDGPFAGGSFTGAVGVETVKPDGTVQKLLVGHQAKGWVTFDAMPDPGTGGTSLPYSVRTAGVTLANGKSLLIDVFAGANQLKG
jgi:hypothetical protein